MEKITLEHPDSQSADLISQQIEQLSQLFPEVIKEGRVDFEALQDLLGNYIDTPEERFQLNWAGKAQARREAQKRSTGTLRPCPEESVDWKTTENLYIEGDNLEVLKLLQKSYYKKVKMIYIDPPYNTGNDFVYKDNYFDNLTNYLEISGQDRTLETNPESEGRYHSNWLNMMYPRLKLARNLLTEEGVIYISIDDNEAYNLKKICDEIFGEINFIACIVWHQGRKSAGLTITTNHEYILVYSKNKSLNLEINNKIEKYWKEKKGGLDIIYKKERELRLTYGTDFSKISDEMKLFYKQLGINNPAYGNKHYNQIDAFGLYFSDNAAAPDKPETRSHKPLIHPVTGKETAVPSLGWRFNEETLQRLVLENRIHFGTDETKVPCIKRYLKETEFEVASSVIYKDGRGASIRLNALFERKIFDFPKDENIISQLINYVIQKEDEPAIIFDFFSGSSTTAHAVMNLNAEDGGNRKYIMVQLPEITPEDSEARKAGYKTIAEIGKERIRRAGKKIVEELKAKKSKEGALFAEEQKKLDIGFKVFKLDSSNINTWDSSPSNLEGALYNSVQNIKSDRTEHDLLYEILLKYGIDLVQPINEHVLAGKKVYEMGAGTLIVCMADHIKPDTAEAIVKLWEEVRPKAIDESSKTAINCRVVFKDNGFDDNNDKTNVSHILKQHGIDNVVTI